MNFMKKSTKRLCLKLAAGFLSTTLVASVALPMQVLATNSSSNNVDYTLADSTNNETPELRDEILSERTEYSKVFSTSDGGFYKVVSATPLHTLESDGTYSNIVETDYDLNSEEAVQNYVATVSEETATISDTSEIATLSNDTESYDLSSEDSILEDTNNLTVLCMNTSGTVSDTLYVQGSRKGNKSIYIKPNSLECNGDKIITEAKLIAYSQGSGSTVNNFVVASQITSDWSADATTPPSSTIDYFDCKYVATQATNYAWDITALMNSWELGVEEMNGLVLKTTTRTSNCNVTMQNLSISYYYHQISEQDVTLASETIDMGRAGTLYINDFSCTPVLVRDEIGVTGEKNPVNIQRIYNPLASDLNSPIGQQWRLNYRSTITYSNYVYCWETLAGENIYFTAYENSTTQKTYRGYDYKGDEYTLTLIKSPLTGIFDYTYYEGVTIIASDGSEYSFESHATTGFMNKFVDGNTNENTIIIDYTYLDNTENIVISDNIQKITDGAGRQYIFEYSDTTNTVLNKISVLKSDNTAVLTNCNGNDVAMEINYTYATVNNKVYLSSVEYIDDTEFDSVSYTYDSLGRIKTIVHKDKTLTLNYTSETNGAHILSYTITKGSGDNIRTIESVTIDSSDLYRRVFTNRDNETRVINFDKYFNIVYYKEYDGKVLHGIVDNNELRYIDRNTNSNLVQNSGFEIVDDNGWPKNWNSEVCELSVTSAIELNSNVLGILGDTYYEGDAWQIVSPQGGFKMGEHYSFGALSQNSSALISTGTRTYGVYIYTAVEEDGATVPGTCLGHISFDETTDAWQSRVSSFEVPQDMESVIIYLRYDYNYETVYFDDVSIQKLDIGEAIESNYTAIQNANGSITQKYISSPIEGDASYVGSEYTYNDTNGYLTSITDENGVVTYYNYNPDNGTLESIATGNSSYVQNLTYNADKLLTQVSQTITAVNGQSHNLTNSYSYTDDGDISSITHDGYTYEYSYDDYGNVTSIGLNGLDYDYETYTYTGAYNDKIGTIRYANGYVLSYSYNADDSITSIIRKVINEDNTETVVAQYTYEYDADGNVASVVDSNSNLKVYYTDSGFILYRINGDITVKIHEVSYSDGVTYENFMIGQYDVISNQSYSETTDVNHNTVYSKNKTMEYTDINTNTVFANVSVNETNKKDAFGRIIENSIRTTYDDTEIETPVIINSIDSYTYKSTGDKLTNLVQSYNTNIQKVTSDSDSTETVSDLYDFTFNYSYDSRGNVTQITLITADDPDTEIIYALYKYDEANQLIFEGAALTGLIVTYTYDANGNLTTKSYYDEYDLENDVLPAEPYETVTFTYSSNENSAPNLLTSYNGTEINYDKMGNPINYSSIDMIGDEINGTFEWNGNLLTAFESSTERYEYDYDETGLRTKKTTYEKTTDSEGNTTYTNKMEMLYIWDNSVLKGTTVYFAENNASMHFSIIYDDNGLPKGYIGFEGMPYYFIRDGLGNIIYIESADGEIGYSVTYDAWGHPFYDFGSGVTGMVAALVAMYNPMAFNNYIYDFETNLYYCNSRYYSATWGRFLSMDNLNVMKIDQLNILSTNPYNYCCNDPINRVDVNGFFSLRSAVNTTENYLMNLNVYSFDFVSNAFSTLIKIISQEEMKSNRDVALTLVKPLVVTMAGIILDRTYSGNNVINSYLIDIIYNYSTRYSIAPSIQHLLPAFRRAL